jgi:hypothetical protein
MNFSPKISVDRAVTIFNEMVGCRRYAYSDQEFFKMSDYLKELCSEESDGVRIKTFKTNPKEDFRRKVGVIEFGNSVIFSMDERFLTKADQGCYLCNYIIAHEIGHLALRHHEKNAKILNFQLTKGQSGYANLPPTDEELEANYAAVFFQCGIALFDDNYTPQQLARLACSDPRYVEKAQKMVRLARFQELRRNKPRYPRVIL